MENLFFRTLSPVVENNSEISPVSKHCSIFGLYAGQTNKINLLEDLECYLHHVQTVPGHMGNKGCGQQIPQKRLWIILDWQ